MLLFSSGNIQAQLVTISPDAEITITEGLPLYINGSLQISNGATVTEIGSSTISLTDDWINNGTFSPDTGLVEFRGTTNSSIEGTNPSDFFNLTVDKSNSPTDILSLEQSITVDGDLSIGDGVFRFENSAVRDVDLNGSLIVDANGNLDIESLLIQTHTFSVAGDIQNDGSIDLSGLTSNVNLTIDGTGNSLLTGTGATNEFNLIGTNKSLKTDTITVISTNFSVPGQFLTLNGGTLRLTGTYSLNTQLFYNYGVADAIPSNSGLWLDNSNLDIPGQSGDLVYAGLLKISDGVLDVGVLGNGSLLHKTGSEFILEDGEVNIEERFSRTSGSETINYTQSGGKISVGVGTSINQPYGIFDVGAAGSVFNLSGGTIELQRHNSNAIGSYYVQASTGTVTGGALLINAQAGSATFEINSTRPVGTFTMQAGNNPVASLDGDFTVLGDVTLAGAGSNRFTANTYTLTIGGDLNNNFDAADGFNAGSGIVTLNGSTTQNIQGSQSTAFYNLRVNKTGGRVELNQPTRVDQNLRMLTNTVVDMNSNDLRIGRTGNIYSDLTTAKVFNNSKMIINSGGVTGASLIKEIENNPTLPLDLLFPLGTDTVYTPSKITFLLGGATINSNPELGILVIPSEHPNVQKTNVSLQKYWQISTAGTVDVNPNGATLQFWYHQSEVRGSEGNYEVLQYENSMWDLNPGLSNSVLVGPNRFLAELTSDPITGDWTAGEEDAVIAKYYSIADGNWNDASSWSKVSYGGPAASTAPNTSQDVVYIGDDKTITLSAALGIDPGRIYVQNTGRLNMQSYVASPDTFKLETGGTLGIGHTGGITASASNGNVQGTNRVFDENATYVYTGNTNQMTGDGLPTVAKVLRIEKDAEANTVSLTRNVQIRDSLIIEEGTLDMTTNLYTVNGESANKFFTMSGGKIILREDFPQNYSSCTFTGGTVEYNTNTGFDLPSGISANPGVAPAVYQFANLTIRGDLGFNYITFNTMDTIRISGAYDISNLNFTNFNTPRFLTNGSTIHFNGTGNQDIPRDCLRDADWARMNYFNLRLSGGGTKQLIDRDHLIYNNVILESAEFDLNGHDIEVQGDWVNTGADFLHDSQDVTMNNIVASTTNTILTNGEPFFNLNIDGPGEIHASGDIFVDNDFEIFSGGTFNNQDDTIYVFADWINDGSYVANTGKVIFHGSGTQTIDTDPTETFYDLVVDKSSGFLEIDNSSGRNILITSNLEFREGNLYARDNGRYVSVQGTITRSGTGHVDGPLRRSIATGATGDILYTVGRDSDYVPMTLTFSGTGGTQGYLQVEHTPASGGFAGSDLNPALSVDRRWEVTVPSGSTFSRGIRTFNSLIQFLASDVPGSADPLKYQTRRDTNSTWNYPTVGTRTSTSTQALGNNGFGRFVVGQPDLLVYYSVADGNWNAPSTWSTGGYGGSPETVSFPSANDSVKIGDGYNVTMNVNHTVNAVRAVVVEKAGPSDSPGTLTLGTYVISGGGAFVLDDEGILEVGSPDGITSAGATGNIQTTTREYNYLNHDNGNFVYNGTTDQVTGSGLPSVIQSLTIDNAGNTVDLTADIEITDEFDISNGSFDVTGSDRNITIGGDWLNSGTFIEQNGTVTFNGSSDQDLTNTSAETFYNLEIDKSSGSVILTDNSIDINNTLTFTDGVIDGRANSYPVIINSSGSISHTSGYVDGELRQNVPTGDASAITYHIGNGTAYTPAEIDVNGTGGTAGPVGVIAYGSDNPNITSSTLDTNKNVQRYWDISNYGSFSLGTRDYDLTLTFLNPDDIRGGADPANFVIEQYLSSVWTQFTTIGTTSTTTQAENFTSMDGEFAVGESSGGSGDIFYSISSGDWDDGNNWSYTGYGDPPASDYPEANNDIVFIGDGISITLDQDRTIGSVTVEALGGTGTLVFGTNVLSGNQFELKDGGKLSIGDADGITASGATGNVRTTIRNYNHSSHNNGNFVYTGNAANTGNGLPPTVATVEINNLTTILLTDDVEVTGDLTITSGTFSSNNNDITLGGDWINNSTYTAGNETVTFNGSTDQNIDGSSLTIFNNVTLDKSAGDIRLQINTRVNGTLDFDLDALIKLNNNDLIIGESGLITGTSLGSNQMIVGDGTASAGVVTKKHSSGTNVQRNFTFPVGVGSDYNPAQINLTADFAANSEVSLQLRSGLHPNRVSNNTLSKFWTVSSSGVSNIRQVANTDYEFEYLPGDVNGTQTNYIPAYYSAGVWEANLGTSRDATSTPVDVSEHQSIDGDWTAGEPGSIFDGRIFYSLNDGDWSTPGNWSNISHSGAPAAYSPGTFPYDTVIIDNTDDIDFDLAANGTVIQDMTIGQTIDGDLNFERGSNKILTILGDLLVGPNGSIDQTGSGDRLDTLIIHGNLTNNSTPGVDEIDLRSNDSRRTALIFEGTGNSTLSGEGDWDLSIVNIDKSGGLSDTTINLSVSFTNEWASAVNSGHGDPQLISGIYRHDNTSEAVFDDNGGSDYFMYVNSGLHLLQGDVTFNDDLITNNNVTILIDGGTLNVGSGNNENFLYQTGTSLTLRSGEMIVAACFSNYQSSSAIDLIIEGGTLTVVDVFSNQFGDIFGFGMKSNSNFTWTDGTIIYANPTNGGFDYVVDVASYSITGGTLQFGIVGNLLSSSQSHSMSSTTPIFNMRIEESRYNTTPSHSAMILLDNENNIINDIIINTNGTFDLNGNNLNIGGDFMNFGRFTPDGRGWNTGGTQRVTFNGISDQYFFNLNSYINNQSGSSMNNEPFYDLVIDKTGGNLILDTAVQVSNSNIFVRNKLEFGINNVAAIEGRTNDNYVEIDTRSGADLGQINRYNLGHVDGLLRMEVGTGAQNVKFHVGAADDYTPATLTINGSGGSGGKIDVIEIPNDPSNISANGIGLDTNRNIQRYWTIGTADGFSLGSRDFDLVLQFINPDDFRGGANWTLFQQFRADVTPYIPLTISTRTDTTTKSTGNTNFGDVLISEIIGTRYFSRQDGLWSDPNTWSTVAYGGPAASSYPQFLADEAYISDGDSVSLQALSPTIKGTTLEEYNGQYGTLYIGGSVWIDGESFLLNDSCSLGIASQSGILAMDDFGSIRTDTRFFGESRYEYNAQFDAQDAGDALPQDILSLIINNSASLGFSLVSLNLNQELNISGDLWVQDGEFDAGPGNTPIRIGGDMRLDTLTELYVNTRPFEFNGIETQYLEINREGPIEFYQFDLYKLTIRDSVVITGNVTDADITISNRLRFYDGNEAFLKSRPDHRVIIEDGAVVQRQGASPYGHVDGWLQKQYDAGADTATFEIGFSEDYAPATVMFDNGSGGTAGPVDAINFEPVPVSPFWGNRMDTVVQVPRWWRIVAGDSTFTLGNRKVNTNFSFPLVEIGNVDTSNAVVRRNGIPTEAIEWTERRGQNLNWSVTQPYVVLSPVSPLWAGIGDFYIGEKAQRIFYSIQDGDWDDNNTWAFDPAGTILAPPGIFPNEDWDALPGFEYEVRDSVVIDDNDIVTLNTLPELAYLNPRDDGTLIMPDTTFIRQSSLGISQFEMTDNSTLNIKSPLGIELEADTANSILRFGDAHRSFETSVNFEFTGNEPQSMGTGFPDSVNNVSIANTGVGPQGKVALKPDELTVLGDLTVTLGELRPVDLTSDLNLVGDLTVEGTLDMTLDSSGASVATLTRFSGSGAGNQAVSGIGTINLYDMAMNRGGGTGSVFLNNDISVFNQLDFQDGTNPNDQIIELGTNIDLSILNSDPASITDYNGSGPVRYVRTSISSGSLIRELTTGNTYVYPVGTFDVTDQYTPATFTAGATGSDGTVAVRVSPGANTTYPDAHQFLDPVRTTAYIERYWALDDVTTTIPGQWSFDYLDADVPGSINENDITDIGRWNPPKETAGGFWTVTEGALDLPGNSFESISLLDAGLYSGDWTIANAGAFRRIFYSRQSGNWNDEDTWTYLPTHSGPIFGPGLFPSGGQDSVVIGGGNAGVGNHEVELNVGPKVNIGGVALGTGLSNTGTLDFGTNAVAGRYFTLGDRSTLKLGSPDGISAFPDTSSGNIRTYLTRELTDYLYTGPGGPYPVQTKGIFIFNGTANQNTGAGIPDTVYSIEIENTGIPGDNIVTLIDTARVLEDLTITQGALDLQDLTAMSVTGTGEFVLDSLGTLRIGGDNDMLETVDNYAAYTVADSSTVEFYGDSQIISDLPLLIINGLGNVVLTDAGNKIVDSALLVRGNMYIRNSAQFRNDCPACQLQVYGNIINNASLNNEGLIEIGQ